MSDGIVSRLFKSHRKIEFLAEDVNPLYEADEDEDEFEDAPGADEEYAALTKDDEEEEHDDSQAPIQGSPDDEEPTESESEIDDTESDEEMEAPAPHSGGGPRAPMGGPGGEDMEMPEEEVAPLEEEPVEDENPTEYENPLDNQYAVKFTLGDEVNLTATGTKNSDIKKGVIQGYDPEGFYKVKWSDESTTNGLTDIALEELVKKGVVRENKCVCGCKKFVEEEGQTLCDKCGRLKESTLDALTLADKSRPKGKRMIRSEAHPVSTANRPNIDMAEAIRNAFKGRSIREEDDPEIDADAFSTLKNELDNEFWTRQNELQEDIEDMGYTVDEINDEYVVISSPDDEENAYRVPIEGTSRSFYLNFDKARMI